MNKKSIISLLLIFQIVFLPICFADGIMDSPYLKATLTLQDPDPVNAGEEVELRFSIVNDGKSTAKNTEFQITPEYPLSLSPGQDEIKEAGDIKIYDAIEIDTGEAVIKYKLKVDSNALEGEYNVVLKYRTEGGLSRGNWIEFDPFIIKVGGKASNVIVQETKTEPERIAPGQSGDVTLVLGNQGATEIEDVSVVLDLQNTTKISPLKTSNEAIIKQLKGGETAEATFNLIVAPDAEVKVYTIPVKISYTDQRDNKYEKTTYVSLVVDAEPEYVLNLEESELYQKGQNGNIVVSLSNIGIANINYATLTLLPSDDYTTLSTDTVYIGNLESDDYETAQYKIYANVYKEELPLKFRLVYKDGYNKEYDEQITLTTKMFTSWEARKYGLTQGSSGFFWIAVLIIAGGAGWYFWRRKKLAK